MNKNANPFQSTFKKLDTHYAEAAPNTDLEAAQWKR